jgi:hypothetical protein
VLDLVSAAPGLDLDITELPSLGSEAAPEGALHITHVPEGFWLMHCESLERFLSAGLGYRAGLFARAC